MHSRPLAEHHLVAVVKLRDAAQGRKKRHREPHPGRIVPQHVARAVMVVVREEDHQVRQVLVREILGQDRVDPRHALVPPDLVLGKGAEHRLLEREVHDAGQMAVEAVPVGIPRLPVGDLRDVHVPAFAHDVHLRVLAADRLAPLGHRLGLVVRVGVHAEAVQARVLDPPHRPLLEVAQYVRVVQVHVRHRRDEPAALLPVAVLHGSVRIHIHREERVHLHVRLGDVVPVREGRVVHPPVGRAAVVGDDVHDHFQPLPMGLVHELPVQGVVAEARIDVVIVSAGVAVVGLLRLVVQQQRGVPDGRRAQVGDIVQMVDDALEVAPVPGHRILAVDIIRRFGNGPRNGGAVVIGLAFPGPVVAGAAGSEPVGHDQVNHVGRRETGAVGTPLLPLADQIRILDLLDAIAHHQIIGARGGMGLDFHVHEQVVRAGGRMGGRNDDALAALDADFLRADPRALHHQLQRGFHPGPPAKRFHPGYFLGRRIRHLRGIELRLATGQSGRHRRRRQRFHKRVHFVKTIYSPGARTKSCLPLE